MKKLISVLLCAAIDLCLFACGKTETPLMSEGVTVTDAAGYILAVPDKAEPLSIASVYAVSVPFLKALGLTKRVTAINCKSDFWKQADPYLKDAGSVGRGTVDLEALAACAPVVLIHRANDRKTVEAVNRIGVDVLCISAEDMDGVKNTISLMGEYFGVQKRAAEVLAWIDEKSDYINGVVSSIPSDERVTALCMGGEPGRIAGSDMLQSWMIEKAGGKCVAVGTKNDSRWLDVGAETVFKLNPSFLFCTSSAPLSYSAESLKKDKAWGALTAVKNADIYVIPAKLDSWDLPGVSCMLGVMYMTHCMYPSYFSAEELQRQIDDYYTFMFGKTFDSGYLGYELS